ARGFDAVLLAAIVAPPHDLGEAFAKLAAGTPVISPSRDGGINFIGLVQPEAELLAQLELRRRDLREQFASFSVVRGSIDLDEETDRARRRVRDPGAVLHRLVFVRVQRCRHQPRGNGRGGRRRGGDPRRRHDRALGAVVQRARAPRGLMRRVIVIGAGPMGIAAAIGALDRGLDVVVLERDEAGSSLRTWGATRFFSPLHMNVSARMRELLGDAMPDPDALLTGPELADLVLAPIAEHAHVRAHHNVIAVGRRGLTRADYAG